MLDCKVKKLWNGCVSLRDNWIKLGIANGGLCVELKVRGKSKGKMRVDTNTLSSLLSKPSLEVISKIDGKPYKLFDVMWVPEDVRQIKLFGGRDGQ